MPVDKPPRTNTMDIYSLFRWPEGIPQVPLDQLTEEQRQQILNLYRFSGFRPGTYQGITGKGEMP